MGLFDICSRSIAAIRHLLLISLLLSSNSFLLKAQDLEFHQIRTQQGLSHSTVYDIAEDEKGFIWFGTREGLNRFDGHQIKTYYRTGTSDQPSGLTSDHINQLHLHQNRLFIGTSKGLFEYLPKQEQFQQVFSGNAIEENVFALATGNENLLLIGTPSGLYTLDEKNQINKILEGFTVRSVSPYKNGTYWVALNKRMLLVDEGGEVLREYPLEPGNPSNGSSLSTHVLFKDSSNRTWLGTSGGLFYYNEKQDDFQCFELQTERALEANVIRDIAEDKEKNLWLGTESGLYIYHPDDESFEHYSHSLQGKSNSLSDKAIYSLHIGELGMAWIGTYFGGVNYTAPEGRGFHTLLPGTPGQSLSGKAISQIISDNRNNLWIGTEDGGISIFNRKNDSFSYLNTSNGLSSNNVHALLKDDRGIIWIGTFLGGITSYNPATGTARHLQNRRGDSTSLSNNNVYAILQEDADTFWVGTQFGLNLLDRNSGNFRLFKPEIFGDKFIYDMLKDRQGDLWICTRFSGIYRYNASADSVAHYADFQFGDEYFSNEIISVTEDSRGDIWFGTLNGGALKWDAQKKSFKSIRIEDGLPNNNVYGIVESEDNRIWMTTNKGLTSLDPGTGKMTTFTSEDGLPTNQFNFKSVYKDPEGSLYLGTVNGLTYFHPDSLVTNLGNPNLQFTGFKLFNKEVSPTEKGILTKQINYTDSITLKHHQNVMSFEFAALNYQQGNKYAYFLDGFDISWNEVGAKRSATYTNLSPGEYTFRVQTLPLNNSQERSIHLEILPPFWKTDLAYTAYGILCVLLLFGLWKFQRFINHQKMAVQLEKVEKEKIRELNQHKLNFFTFISHEFKTPLTLILASIEKHLKKNPGLPSRTEELRTVQKNAARLQHLISQLMEFRKTETDLSRIDLKQGDIILFLKDTFQAFSLLMDNKNLNYSYKCDFSEYHCYFDPDKVEMIITNLLSNAIKNTPEQGEIHLDISISSSLDAQKRSQLKIIVRDTGQGMDKKNIEKIFNPFFKIGSTSSKWQSDSGIGLALVNNLTQLLEGSIQMDSVKGEGTEIQVSFPLKLKIPPSEKEVPVIIGNKTFSVDPDILLDEPPIPEVQTEEPLVRDLSLLIVEDNKQVQRIIQEHFSGRFKILTASNGLLALKKLETHTPDFIISDVMMEEMDGISLCKKVKSTPKTSHIPFILLTGKNEDSYKMEGLRVGANAFIPKPFSLRELDLIVKNLLETTHNRSKRFSGGPSKPEGVPVRNNQNEEFLKQVNDIIDQNFSDPGFTIEDLAAILGISRSLLHIKLKKITGSSASEILKKARLQKAADLIMQGKTISEVASEAGYSDPNYFSRVFKKEFRVSPTSYRLSSK